MAFINFIVWLAVCTSAIAVPESTLPIIDLGYALNQATLNSSCPYPLLTFSNIRFGAPPVGDLRFAAPIPPQTVNTTVNNGQQTVICPQATPTWASTAYAIVDGLTAAISSATSTTASSATASATSKSSIPAPAAGTSEDCLFLDVVVPQKIYDSSYAIEQRALPTNQSGELSESKGVPVLVWLYGGGYIFGDKQSQANPSTLVANSLADGHEGVIYVAPNYRLGLFGWQASSAFEAEGGTTNAGLFDQRLALEWIQKYISLFGGDPSRVTLMGESAGAGSIFHHITAPASYNTSSLFTKGITQSPALEPITDAQKTATYDETLLVASKLANTSITTLEQLRALPFELLYEVNFYIVATSYYGTFTFGPAIDGSYVPALPGMRLLNGSFDHNISIIAARNENEGIFFTNPTLQNSSAFDSLVQNNLPDATPETIAYITNVLYPPVFNGSYPYLTQFERGALFTQEFTITCNSYFLAKAFAGTESGKAWKYIFAVPPGLHSDDIAYTFFNGDTSTLNLGGGVVNATIANVLQDFIVNFAESGQPAASGYPHFPKYEEGRVYNLNVTELGKVIEDPDDNPRCNYWQAASWL